MKKVKTLLLGFVITVFCIFPAFTNGQNENKAAAEPKSVEVWAISNPNETIIKAFDEAAVNFETKTGIKVNYIRIPTNDFHTKLVTSISAGVFPDMIIWNTAPGIEFSSTKMVEPMNDMVSEIGREKFGEGTLKMFTIGDTLYEAPFLVRPAGIHARKSWLEKAGYDVTLKTDPKTGYYMEGLRTWQDLLVAGKKMTDIPNGKYGLGFAFSRKAFGDSAAFAFSIISSFGGSVLNANGKVDVDTPQMRAAIKYLQDVWNSGAVPAACTTWDGNANNQYFITGDIGICMNSNSISAKLNDSTNVKPDDLVMIPVPSGPAGSYIQANPESITIFKTKNLEATKEYARYLLSEDTQIEMFKTMGFGYYSPLRKDVMANPLFDSLSSNEKVLMADASKAIGASFPGEPDARLSSLYSAFFYDDILSRIAVDGWSVDQIINEMGKKANEALFD
ncbi:extracellular solute-binding protein [uncultured Sphaerochaeta sp.]|uniref:ABC transporter substrate-binding protein n=1 Tax=uncultured Sphaerochaeta sp. TaxID=886478 RepID=UPI002A0A490A|nr:extracellular solute-binding protein [uncultured Sphaerochaeta sp.]